MKFLSIYKTVERNTPPSAEEMAAMGKLVEEGFKAGWLVATEGCLPSALGARVRRSGGSLERDGWAVHGIEGTRRRVRDSEGELEGGGDSVGQRLPESGGRRRVRTAPDLRNERPRSERALHDARGCAEGMNMM